jgi:hypothetical protein
VRCKKEQNPKRHRNGNSMQKYCPISAAAGLRETVPYIAVHLDLGKAVDKTGLLEQIA